MEIIKLTPDKYEEWDKFCLESDDAWFWHTSKWLEYNLNYKTERTPQSFSFFVKDEQEKIVAVCPLILEKGKSEKEFSFGEISGPPPALKNGLEENKKEEIIKQVFNYLDKLAEDNGVMVLKMRFSEDVPVGFGFIDVSIATRVIDLRKPLENIKKEIRHGHWYDITTAEKILKSEIYDCSNITKEIFGKYQEMKKLITVGGKVRPDRTFDLMFEIIKAGNGFLVGAKEGEEFVGLSYFFLYKNYVYYGSACVLPNKRNLFSTHFIQWQAIKYMKEKGFHFYEIGWQVHGANWSEKEINISKFKRGFGGFDVPLFIGEKRYAKISKK